MNPCQCEHESHFTDKYKNYPHHPYWMACGSDERIPVRTPFGTFLMCRACVSVNHMELTDGIMVPPSNMPVSLAESTYLGVDGSLCVRLAA